MTQDETLAIQSGDGSTPRPPEVPLPELVLEVYDCGTPAVRNRMLSQLVGRVYDAAPPAVRSLMLTRLLRPLGVLSLVTVANGIFAKIRFRGELALLQIRVEDAASVRGRDVVALVDYVLQSSGDALNGLAEIIARSPVLASSTVAVMLMMVLLKREQRRRSTDSE